MNVIDLQPTQMLQIGAPNNLQLCSLHKVSSWIKKWYFYKQCPRQVTSYKKIIAHDAKIKSVKKKEKKK